MATKARKIKLLPVSDDDWQVKSDFHTLLEYKKICKDKSRHEKVLTYAKQMKEQASSIVTDLIEEKMEGEE